MKRNNFLILFFVLAGMISACETAFERDLRNRKVVLLAPVDDLVTTDTLQTFYWETMDGALEYQLQVVSPRFDSIVQLIRDTTIITNRFTIDMPVGTYQWRVKAFNDGSSSAFSDINDLKIQ